MLVRPKRAVRGMTRRDACRRGSGTTGMTGTTDLLHDAGLSLGEGDVTTRLVLDELDLDLSSLAAGLVLVGIGIICWRSVGCALSFLRAAAFDAIILESRG